MEMYYNRCGEKRGKNTCGKTGIEMIWVLERGRNLLGGDVRLGELGRD